MYACVHAALFCYGYPTHMGGQCAKYATGYSVDNTLIFAIVASIRMLKIRLQRIGRKNDPSFRVVVTEHTRGPKSEKHVDRVGFYNPKTKEQQLDGEKIKDWIAKGAKASDTVHNMLVKAGIIDGTTINVLPQKSPVVKEDADAREAAPTTEAPTAESGDASDGEGTAAESQSAEETPESESATETADEGEQSTPPADAEGAQADATDTAADEAEKEKKGDA